MNPFYITFWGVRGTTPLSSPHTMRYGGNTSCVEVRCGNQVIILDAGTGIFPLGQQCKEKAITILLSHLHIDHIQGLPLFSPMYETDVTIDMWAGNLLPNFTLQDTVHTLLQPPFFPPIIVGKPSATLVFHDFRAGESLDHSSLKDQGIEVKTIHLHHPGGATGYRITYQGKSLCYITDVEHQEGMLDQHLINFIKNTDVFIYDCTFDDRNFEQFRGWGHSTWQHAALLAKEAGVKQLVDFHHDPFIDDNALDKRAKELEAVFAHSSIAKEGQVIILS